jgi:DNA-binding beta-propeller fold protein YncE
LNWTRFEPYFRTVTLRVLVASMLLAAGCGIGESGIAPPNDRIFFPASLAVDPSGDWLYVVNSNSDLRYNAGTVSVLDLSRAKADRNDAKWAPCPRTRHVPSDSDPARFCCRDLLDNRVLDCNERGYGLPASTVRIGSFGSAIAVQRLASTADPLRRLFVAVRAEPSITFIDARLRAGRVTLTCTGVRTTAAGAGDGTAGTQSCDDAWRVSGVRPDDETFDLQEEPHSLVLDEELGLLYVAHLGGFDRGAPVTRAVSVIDVCAPSGVDAVPTLVSRLDDAFPGTSALGVTSLTLAEPGDPGAPIFATSQGAFEITELALAGGAVACPRSGQAGALPRPIKLVPGAHFLSSAFVPSSEALRGFDVRGFALSEDGGRGFVLHRNSGRFDPSAMVVVDIPPRAGTRPTNQATEVVEVCTGPTAMVAHDAGRGRRLFITCFEGGQIYVIDPQLPAVSGIIDVGVGPTSLVFSPVDPTIAFVAAFADNSISVIDLRPGSATEYRTIQRLGFPRSAVLD